jgi:3-hydroxyacyl-CoA dehydrogenase
MPRTNKEGAGGLAGASRKVSTDTKNGFQIHHIFKEPTRTTSNQTITMTISSALLSHGPTLLRRSKASISAIQQQRLFASASSFDKVGVIGLGLMGHGICQVAAASGVHSSVVAYEPEQQYLDKGKERIETSVAKLVAREKITRQVADETLGRITYTTDMSELADTDFVVEAVIENMDLKRDLYSNLGNVCKPETIFASNTSSLSITEMAQFSGRPQNFVGVHFFNPVQIMKLVEVIRTEETNPAVFDRALSWVTDIGKVPVSCGDTPGTKFLIGAVANEDRKLL